MLKRKMYALFILFGVVLFLLAACSQASESVPSATPSNAATSSQASVSEPKNDEPTVTPTTDTEQQPARSFVELATGGTGSASFTAEIITQCPGMSSWYTLDVEIADGIITIDDKQFVQSTAATTPDIVYDEGMLKGYPELADTFAAIKAGEDLFVLEDDGYHLYASFVDDTLYFLEASSNYVPRIFRARANNEQQPARSFVELATGSTGSASFTAEIIAQCPAMSSWYTLDVEIADGIITINGNQYVQSTTATIPDIVYEEGMLKDYPELADTFAKIKDSEDLFVLEHNGYRLYASFVDDTLYFLEITGDCVYRLFSRTI